MAVQKTERVFGTVYGNVRSIDCGTKDNNVSCKVASREKPDEKPEVLEGRGIDIKTSKEMSCWVSPAKYIICSEKVD